MSELEEIAKIKAEINSLKEKEESVVIRYNNADNPILRANLYDQLKLLKAQELALEMAMG